MYAETFITDRQIDEVAEELYFNDEWLDELNEEDEDFPDEDFWAYLDELEEDEDFLPDEEEVPEWAFTMGFN